jgi:hypothetical protein
LYLGLTFCFRVWEYVRTSIIFQGYTGGAQAEVTRPGEGYRVFRGPYATDHLTWSVHMNRTEDMLTVNRTEDMLTVVRSYASQPGGPSQGGAGGYNIYTYIHIYLYTHTHICMYMYTCVYACIHLYHVTYMYTDTYKHIYIYIYIYI